MAKAERNKRGTRSTSALLRAGRRWLVRMTLLLEAAERIEALPTEEPPPRLKELTERELQILRRVATGEEKHLAIYTDLGISKRTFDQHMASIFEKLGVRKSTGAVRVAVKWGLV